MDDPLIRRKNVIFFIMDFHPPLVNPYEYAKMNGAA